MKPRISSLTSATALVLSALPGQLAPLSRRARSFVPALAVAGLTAVLGAHGAHAQGGETFTPDPTAYAGTITNTGTFVTSMIATYAPKAILISVALGGVGLIWGWARRAVGH